MIKKEFELNFTVQLKNVKHALVYISCTCDQKCKGMNLFFCAFVERMLFLVFSRITTHFTLNLKLAHMQNLLLKAIYGKQ